MGALAGGCTCWSVGTLTVIEVVVAAGGAAAGTAAEGGGCGGRTVVAGGAGLEAAGGGVEAVGVEVGAGGVTSPLVAPVPGSVEPPVVEPSVPVPVPVPVADPPVDVVVPPVVPLSSVGTLLVGVTVPSVPPADAPVVVPDDPSFVAPELGVDVSVVVDVAEVVVPGVESSAAAGSANANATITAHRGSSKAAAFRDRIPLAPALAPTDTPLNPLPTLFLPGSAAGHNLGSPIVRERRDPMPSGVGLSGGET